MSVITVHVEGMSCGGCAGKVREEISAVPGAGDVEVDLESGRVTVTPTGRGQLDEAAVEAAVRAAGYRTRAPGPADTSTNDSL